MGDGVITSTYDRYMSKESSMSWPEKCSTKFRIFKYDKSNSIQMNHSKRGEPSKSSIHIEQVRDAKMWFYSFDKKKSTNQISHFKFKF